MPFPKFDPARVRAARKAAGFSYNDLHLRCGLSLDSVKAYETGRARPLADSAAALATALGLRIDDLFTVPADDEAADGGDAA